MSENQNIINENVVEKAEKQVRVKPVPDANFDWNCDPKKDDNYKSEERMKLEAMYEKTMSQIGDHEVIEGTVVVYLMFYQVYLQVYEYPVYLQILFALYLHYIYLV